MPEGKGSLAPSPRLTGYLKSKSVIPPKAFSSDAYYLAMEGVHSMLKMLSLVSSLRSGHCSI